MELNDRLALLETEARIIAEDDKHAVIALRIDKAAIARTLPFLAALGDLVSTAETALPDLAK